MLLLKNREKNLGSGARRKPQASRASDYNFFDREGEARGVVLSSIRNNSHKNRYFNIRHENRIKVTFLEIKK